MNITFQDITPANFNAVVKLKVAPEQEGFVATNVRSIAQSKVWPNLIPKAIYADDALVGFTLYTFEKPTYWIVRFMMDAAQQGKGYGRAALKLLIAQFRTGPECLEVGLSYEPHNHVAAKLYASEGFVETGEMDEGEAVAKLVWSPTHD